MITSPVVTRAIYFLISSFFSFYIGRHEGIAAGIKRDTVHRIRVLAKNDHPSPHQAKAGDRRAIRVWPMSLYPQRA